MDTWLLQGIGEPKTITMSFATTGIAEAFFEAAPNGMLKAVRNFVRQPWPLLYENDQAQFHLRDPHPRISSKSCIGA